jgi:hypothetical protein
MQKAKALFDELTTAGRPVSLEDFNLYVFCGLRREFKDLVTSLVTKTKPLSYVDLHSHLLTHEFLHKTPLSSIGSTIINTPLLPTPNTPPTVFFSHRQSPGNFARIESSISQRKVVRINKPFVASGFKNIRFILFDFCIQK